MKLNELINKHLSKGLLEMPVGISDTDMYPVITEKINKVKDKKVKVKDFYKAADNNNLLYWYEDDDGNILLGAEFINEGKHYLVNDVGKIPGLEGQPPYASTLYIEVLKDNNLPIMSDVLLTHDGLQIWKKLVSLGMNVAVYDNYYPKKVYDKVTSLSELENYFKYRDQKYNRYQFILQN